MRARVLCFVGLLGCGTSEYAAECDLYPERCCDIRPSSPVCADGGDAGEVGETGCTGPTSEACGKCGTRNRACQPDGTFGAWGACEAEGECAAGTTEAVAAPACDKALEKRWRTCSATCSWGAAVCAMPKGWSKMADPPAGFAGRSSHAQAWTGSEYFVFGGVDDKGAPLGDGARWNPKSNTWKAVAAPPVEIGARSSATAVATGLAVIVWGGDTSTGAKNTGAAYAPVSDKWTPIAASPLAARYDHRAVWTGSKMLVWGGFSGVKGGAFADGALYDPVTDGWTMLPPAPVGARVAPAMVWTGSEAIVFGGAQTEVLWSNEAASFNPTTMTWKKLDAAPATRTLPGVALRAGGLFSMGGVSLSGSFELMDDALLFETSKGWTKTIALAAAVLPNPARISPATWCRGSRCWAWSGCTDDKTGSLAKLRGLGGGASFDGTSWAAMDKTNEPTPRCFSTVVEADGYEIVFAGLRPDAAPSNDGAVYMP
ncbi:MAG: hypothetical protein JNL79_22110 [Myxococcales bacterium]|nr:hypothetical protein [Myxococcales bacterium]